MKVLIWLGCLFAGSLVQLFLGYAGIGGALPAMVVFCGMFASAVSLCKRYDAYRNRASASKSVSLARSAAAPVQPPEPPAQSVSAAPIVYCRKCGQRLIPDSAFCSFCGTAIIKE